MSSSLRADSITPATPAWKIEAPPLDRRTLLRPRLIEKIERHVGKERSRGDVLLVSAPAGYGKTTVLAHWAASSELPVMWYHLDASDNDPQALIYGIVRALRTRLPRGHWQVKALLERLHADTLSPLDARRAGEVLIADIQEHVSRPMALVVTGVAEIDRRGVAASLLDQLLLRPHDHLRVLLECREVPELRLSPLLTQQRFEGVGMEELRLTDEEFAELLTSAGVEQDEGDLRLLRDLCAGWVTGALLATGALWPTCLGSHVGDLLNREAVFGYLASEVIDRLPDELGDFAMRASVLNYMTAPICDQLLGINDAQRLLGALARTTGFVTHSGRRPQTPVFRLQPLLRQALLERLENELGGASALRALQSRAGAVLEGAGETEEAAQLYAAAQDYQALLCLIGRQRGALQRSGYGATLARWIDLLPLTVRREHADLDVVLAELHRLAGRTVEALAIAERVCARAASHDDAIAPSLLARALIVRADVRYSHGEYAEAKGDCAEALRLAPTRDDELHVNARFLMTASVNALDGPRTARAWLDGVEERCVRLGDLWALGRLKYVRSNLALADGAYAEAEREANSGLLYAQEANDEIRAFMCLLNLGAIRQYLGHPVPARENLEAALSLSKSSGHTRGQGYALANLGDLEVTTGDYTAAVSWYERALEVERRVDDQRLRVCAIAGIGYALALDGNPDAGRFRVERALASLARQPRGQDWAHAMTALGFVCYQQGDFACAASVLREVGAFTHDHGMTAEEARVHVTCAAVCHAQQDEAGARATLDKAISLAAQTDGTPMSLLDIRHLPALWPLLADSDHPLVPLLLDQIGSPRPTTAASDAAPVSKQRTLAPTDETSKLRVNVMGETRVGLGDEEITSWARPGMRELLVYLLDRETPARRDEILADIWPEKDPRLAGEEFRKVRSELKKALGGQIKKLDDGRYTVAPVETYDAREFQAAAQSGRELMQAGNTRDAIVALRRAVTLGSGAFLTEIYSEWAVLRRDALRREYLLALEQLVEAQMKLKEYAALTRSAYLLLDADPLCEKAHRALMVGFYACGEPARALDQFRQCARTLREELELDPAPQTIALYKTIRSRVVTSGQRQADASSRAVASHLGVS